MRKFFGKQLVVAVLGALVCLGAGPLSGQSIKAEKYYRGTPANPLIQQMVDAVSADTLEADVIRLVGFHTRHTSSDTSSADTGIGAARNYIHAKFQQYAARNNSPMQASFFAFAATVCGIFNSAHKNVLATIPGTVNPARHFVVSGHMDNRNIDGCDPVIFAPGANDDGSGTVTSMEMARVMSAFSNVFESTVILMAVTGEDEGLFGSTAYANWALANGMRIDGMVTNDVVGNITGCVDPACPNGQFITDSTSVRHFSGGPSTTSSRQLTRYMKLKAEQYVTEVPWKINLIPAIDRPGRSGDHVPFFNNGYTAVRFTEAHEFGDGTGANGHQHNETDLPQFMNFGYLARIVKTNIAGIASLAMAPETPSGPLTIRDVGNGTDLQLSWIPSNTEADFDGYRVAWRHADSLFYQQIVPAGNVTEFILSGLTPDQPVYVSYSAIDTAGNESIFSAEVLATPRNLPATPQGFDATSTSAGVRLDWLPNSELDLAGYTISRTAPDGNHQEFAVGANETTFLDNTAQPHLLYLYTIRSRDTQGNQSPESAPLRGQVATHDLGILIVDASRDGPGGNPLFPTDAAVDAFYDNILANFNVAGQWDIADSAAQQLSISDADMAPFSAVVLHSDVRLPTNPIAHDTSAFRKYVENGGRMLMSGWQLVFSASQVNLPVKIFQPGDFVYDIMQMDTVTNVTTNDFKGADPLAGGYPAVTVDSVKIPNFGGNLIAMESISSLVGGPVSEAVYSYRSSQQPPSPAHGTTVGLRHVFTDLKIVVLDFPLYYMVESQAAQAASRALQDLGEITGIGDQPGGAGASPRRFELSQNFPNPFNPSTHIRYELPTASQVKLTVFNLLGQQVKSVVNQRQEAGSHSALWDGRDDAGQPVASGVYLYRLHATTVVAGDTQEFDVVKKLVLVR